MKLLKFLIVLVLATAIFGTAGFFAYLLYIKPEKVDREEAKLVAEAPPPTPVPDYSLAPFKKLMAVVDAGPSVEGRDALLTFIAQYPKSTKLAEAKAALGEMNMQFVFTSMAAPDKVDYVVVAGDSLVKVASKTKSNAELILRSNNLASIDLAIGQSLRIPAVAMTLVLDRPTKTLSLVNKGQLFKEYPLLAMEVPAAIGKGPAATTVKDKVAIKGAGRVAFGTKDYVGSERWLMLGAGNMVIRGRPEPDANGQPTPMPPGIVVSQEDIEEIFPLVTRGTAVTIQ